MYRTFRYRLYPSKAQARVLVDTLDICHDLYNSLLHWHIHDCDHLGRAPTRFQQQAALPVWKKTHPEQKRVYSQALEDDRLCLSKIGAIKARLHDPAS